MKFALAGLGYWGSKVLRNMVALLGADHVVATDLDERLVVNARATYPGLRCGTDLGAAMADDSEITGVVIATPVASHAALATLALRAGKAVLVEKPLAATSDAAHDLADLAEELRLTLMVGHTFLFSPRLERIRDYVEDGTLGPIHYATMARLALGPYRSDVNVVWDLAPHDLSILSYLLGEHPAVVRCSGRSISRPDALDVAFLSLSYPSGVVAEISVSWLAPRKIRNTVIVGESKMLVYDDMDADEPIKVYDKAFMFPEGDSFGAHQLTYRTGDTIAPFVSPREPLETQLQHFFDCARTGAPCRSDARFGAAIVDALQAADKSAAAEGAPVAVTYRSAGRVPA